MEQRGLEGEKESMKTSSKPESIKQSQYVEEKPFMGSGGDSVTSGFVQSFTPLLQLCRVSFTKPVTQNWSHLLRELKMWH